MSIPSPAEQTIATPVAVIPAKNSPKQKLSPERKAFLEILINELVSRGATSEQLAEARSRVEAMPEAEFQAVHRQNLIRL